MSAVLSPDRQYRYALWRSWGAFGEPTAVWVMLNPSTADESADDPTIRRCVGFSRSWGCSDMLVVNLYALRATNPDELWLSKNPVGPDNDMHLEMALHHAADRRWPVIAAWGARAGADRVSRFGEIADEIGCRVDALGFTKAGQPRHPLYLPATATRRPWRETSEEKTA